MHFGIFLREYFLPKYIRKALQYFDINSQKQQHYDEII